MALNKYMHPRNIYKTPPDFSKLAKQYKQFADIAKQDIAGNVSLDFKDPNALRILTTCLLKSDFGLDIDIPEDRLVPTLPLRLNYILWIEDLMNIINIKNEDCWGIDIGTGACAIYPLLAAVKNKWHMIGTETDDESLKKAKDNIQNNNLHHLIEVRKNTTTSVLNQLFEDGNDQTYHFCMCNPPFYTNIQELWESRSPARSEPKNGFTGSPHELITEGGELQFCRKIIEESKIFRDKVLIFSTMVGHKYNLKELVMDLKADSITYTVTEFCQGRVTRWGLAWTYQDYDFSNLGPSRVKIQKKNIPISFVLPELSTTCDPLQKFKDILKDLKISYKIVTKRKDEYTFDIVAVSNTWSNQRRKRRSLQRLNIGHEKKQRLESEITTPIISTQHDHNTESNGTVPSTTNANHMLETTLNNVKLIEDSKTETVHGLMKIVVKDNITSIKANFLNGSAGKEGLHQIVQYIKNNWKYLCVLIPYCLILKFYFIVDIFIGILFMYRIPFVAIRFF